MLKGVLFVIELIEPRVGRLESERERERERARGSASGRAKSTPTVRHRTVVRHLRSLATVDHRASSVCGLKLLVYAALSY